MFWFFFQHTIVCYTDKMFKKFYQSILSYFLQIKASISQLLCFIQNII